MIDALAELIAETGTTEFSVQDVADRAGVSLRTVYRYFPNRQALLDGVATRVNERMGELPQVDRDAWAKADSVDDLLAAIPEVFGAFDALAPLSTAMTLLSAGGVHASKGHGDRTAKFREILSGHLASLPKDEAELTFAVIRHLMSANTWFALQQEFGLDGRTAGEATAQAVRAILRDVDRHEPSG